MSCVATIYYLLEIRTYSLVLTISMVAATSVNSLLDHFDRKSNINSPYLPYLIALMAALLMITLHAWGALFGGAILITLLFYDRKIAGGIFGYKVFMLIAIAACLLFFIFYLPLLQVFDSRLTAAGIDTKTELSSSGLSLITGFVNLVFVTSVQAFYLA